MLYYICRFYYYIPYEETKPILWCKTLFEDHRKRMYTTNMLDKIADKLEDGLADVNEMMRQERPFPERRLRGVLDELATSCSKYATLMGAKAGGGGTAGRTKLDKERHKLCLREVVSINKHIYKIVIPNVYSPYINRII